MKRIILVLLVFGIFIPLFGPEMATIKGTVTDEEEEPMEKFLFTHQDECSTNVSYS